LDAAISTRRMEVGMSMFVLLVLGWLAIAVLGWSWLATAARADRAHARRRPPRRR
jgi:hypothetical protein